MFGVFGNKKNSRPVTRRGQTYPTLSSSHDLALEDLPCPWCHAQTSDQDPACPSCGRNFGAIELRL